jgi:antitoxin component YwqK of YwqJK toxin-antitoxin module
MRSKDKKTTMDSQGNTIKFHANGQTVWSIGKNVNGVSEGYWQWFRIDGTIKRSGYFKLGFPVGEWITYDKEGNVYKKTQIKE